MPSEVVQDTALMRLTPLLSDGTQFTFESDRVAFFRRTDNGVGVNAENNRNTTITIAFDRIVDTFMLDVNDIDINYEYFKYFSILPSSVDGDLYISNETIRSSITNGDGHMTWNDVSSVSFVFDRAYNCGFNSSQMELYGAALPGHQFWLSLAFFFD